MNKYIIRYLILFISLFSCTNSHNSSFDLLAESFSIWNLKFSRTSSFITSYDNILYDLKSFSGDSYIPDIKRFSIELNQINYKKLIRNKQKEYLSIKRFLDSNIFINEKMNFKKWNLIGELNKNLYHISYVAYLLKDQSASYKTIESEINYISDNIKYLLIYNLEYTSL